MLSMQPLIDYSNRFEVCGQIVIDKLPEGIAPNLQRTVKVSSATGTTKQASLLADSAGTFCTDLTPGTYIFKVRIRHCLTKSFTVIAQLKNLNSGLFHPGFRAP